MGGVRKCPLLNHLTCTHGRWVELSRLRNHLATGHLRSIPNPTERHPQAYFRAYSTTQALQIEQRAGPKLIVVYIQELGVFQRTPNSTEG